MLGKKMRVFAHQVVSAAACVALVVATVPAVAVADETVDSSDVATASPISIAKAKIKLSKTSYAYMGKAIKPKVKSVKLVTTSTDEAGKKVKTKITLTEGQDFTVSCTDNKRVGAAKVTIKGIGTYTGSATKKFKIVPKTPKIKRLTWTRTSITIKVAKQKPAVTGYLVCIQPRGTTLFGNEYKTSKALSKTIDLRKRFKNSRVTTKSILCVYVRTYKKVGKKKYWSEYSEAIDVTDIDKSVLLPG